MTPRPKKADAVFRAVDGHPHLELNTKSGIYYVRTSVKGHGEIFLSTRERTKGRAQTAADALIDEIKQRMKDRKAGVRSERITVDELCDLVLVDLEEQTRTKDENGNFLRRMSTYESCDLPYLRGRQTRLKTKRKNTRKTGVIRELFGSDYADEIDEQFWKTWVKRRGRKLGRRLGDIAKYLSLVLDFAYDEKYLARKPTIANPDKHKKKAVAYTDEQILAFFQKAEPLLKEMIIVISENTLRPHEVREMAWANLTFGNEKGRPTVIYRIPEGFAKIGEARDLYLSEHAWQVLDRRREERRHAKVQSPYVFHAPRNPLRPVSKKHLGVMWKRMKKAAKVTAPIKFHWFRHSLYSKLILELNMPLGPVSAAGGTSLQTLEKNYLIKDARKTQAVAAAAALDFQLGLSPGTSPARRPKRSKAVDRGGEEE